MPCEVHDRGFQLTQLAEQIERLGRPSGHKVEPIAITAASQLDMDRMCLLVERQPTRAGRVGRQEQDHLLLRRRPGLRWLFDRLPRCYPSGDTTGSNTTPPVQDRRASRLWSTRSLVQRRPSRIGHRETTHPPDDRPEKVTSAAARPLTVDRSHGGSLRKFHFLVRRKRIETRMILVVAMASLSIWPRECPSPASG